MLNQLLSVSKEKINGAGGSFTVRALTLQDLAILQEKHAAAIQQWFSEESNLSGFVSRFPDACAAVIALAADEPESIESAKKLPVGLQIKAIEAVWRLSEVDEESLGKFLGKILAAMQTAAKNIKPIS